MVGYQQPHVEPMVHEWPKTLIYLEVLQLAKMVWAQTSSIHKDGIIHVHLFILNVLVVICLSLALSSLDLYIIILNWARIQFSYNYNYDIDIISFELYETQQKFDGKFHYL